MAASIFPPLLAVRGSGGLSLKNGPPCDTTSSIPGDESKWLRVMCFSDDGTLFAYCNGVCVTVLSTRNGAEVQKIDRPRTSCLRFSPKNTYLVTWENYAVVKDQQTPPNLNFWSVKTGELIKSAVQKKMQQWFPQFTNDEELLGRWVNNEIQYFSDGDLDRFKAKLKIDKMMEVSVAKAGPPYHSAAFVKGSKGQPSFVRLYRHPNYNSPIANKSFYQADRVSLFWSPSGEHLLVLTATDSSSESYYGDQGLQYLSTSGQSNAIALGKNGPVYHVEWNPKQPEFLVVYGFQPAKATLFNAKCEPLFDFGTGPWNLAYYNSHGNVLCLCGFGNLRGRMECWDVRKRRQISVSTAADTTAFSWCPDGEHIITATTAPRLRVGNGYKIWHYTGSLMYEEHCPHGQELWEVSFQPGGRYPERPIQYSAVESTFSAPTQPAVATLADSIPSVYRPPGARGLAQPTALHTYEKPTDHSKPDAAASANLSKAALKNKKKREAKQRARQEQEGEAPPIEEQAPPPRQQAPPPRQQNQPPRQQNQPFRQQGPPSRQGGYSPRQQMTEETMKKVKNLEKKLNQIEKLKLQQREGKQLELNQLEKLTTEASLRQELAELKL